MEHHTVPGPSRRAADARSRQHVGPPHPVALCGGAELCGSGGCWGCGRCLCNAVSFFFFATSTSRQRNLNHLHWWPTGKSAEAVIRSLRCRLDRFAQRMRERPESSNPRNQRSETSYCCLKSDTFCRQHDLPWVSGRVH